MCREVNIADKYDFLGDAFLGTPAQVRVQRGEEATRLLEGILDFFDYKEFKYIQRGCSYCEEADSLRLQNPALHDDLNKWIAEGEKE